MAKRTITFTSVSTGNVLGTATLNDGDPTYSSDTIASMMRGWIERGGVEKAFDVYADWSNGYVSSKQIDPPVEGVTAAGVTTKIMRWKSAPVLAPFDKMSGDRRKFLGSGKWTFRGLPLPVSYQREDASGHDGGVTVGRITTMDVTPQGFKADGDWIHEVPETAEAITLLDKGVLFPSVDLADYEFQFQTEDGRVLDQMDDDEFEAWAESGEQPVMVFTSGRVGKVTLVSFQAFEQAKMALYEGSPTVVADGVEAVVAAGAAKGKWPTFPKDEWFVDPQLAELTPITVVDDGPDRGRVFGHLTDNDCHMSFLSAGQCVLPPSEGGFEWFHRGEIKTASGRMLAVGLASAGSGHADLSKAAAAAASHYDNTSKQVAVLRAGRDKFGTWVAGSIVPEASDEQVQLLRRSPLSGDWRIVGGRRELVHALCVNMPGYPVVRGRVSQNRVVSLVAAGWEGWHEAVLARRAAAAGNGIEQQVQAVVEKTLAGIAVKQRVEVSAETIAASIGRDRRSRADQLGRAVHGE